MIHLTQLDFFAKLYSERFEFEARPSEVLASNSLYL